MGVNNQILADDTYDYAYDAEGNRIRQTERATGVVTEYPYDHRNRLVQVQRRSAGGIILSDVEYVYDVFDRRIVKTRRRRRRRPELERKTRFVYDGPRSLGRLRRRKAKSRPVPARSGLDELLARYRPGRVSAWYLTDHRARSATWPTRLASVIDHLDYDSFGRVVFESNPQAGDRYRSRAASLTPRRACTTTGPATTTRVWAASSVPTRSASRGDVNLTATSATAP